MYPAGASFSFGATHIHDVCQTGPQPAASLHAYSPPLTTMDRFAVSGGRLVRAAAEMAGQW